MQTSMEFLTKELQTSYKELITPCRQQYIVDKRWTVVLFYIMSGKKKSTIAKLLKIDRNSVDNVIERAKPKLWINAEKLYNIYNGFPQSEEYKGRLILVPDYRHSKIIKEWVK